MHRCLARPKTGLTVLTDKVRCIRRQFRVKWSDLPCGVDEWQPAPHIECHCQELVLMFRKKKHLSAERAVEDFDSDHGDWTEFQGRASLVQLDSTARETMTETPGAGAHTGSAKRQLRKRPWQDAKTRTDRTKLESDDSELTSFNQDEDSDFDAYVPSDWEQNEETRINAVPSTVLAKHVEPHMLAAKVPLPKCHRVTNAPSTHPMCSLASLSHPRSRRTTGVTKSIAPRDAEATSWMSKKTTSATLTSTPHRSCGNSADFYFAGLVPKAPDVQRTVSARSNVELHHMCR